MIIAQWLIASLLALGSLYLFYLNYSTRFARHEAGAYVPSPIPIIGGVLGAVAIALAPPNALSSFWWVPLCLDILVVMLVQTALFFVNERIQKHQWK